MFPNADQLFDISPERAIRKNNYLFETIIRQHSHIITCPLKTTKTASYTHICKYIYEKTWRVV